MRIDSKRPKVVRVEVESPKNVSIPLVLPLNPMTVNVSTGPKPHVYKWEVGSPEIALDWVESIRYLTR